MIQSMTGYGKATAIFGEKKINVEIKSLNSKAMDLSTRIAPLYREKEMEIRNMISKSLERGKVDFSLWIQELSEDEWEVVRRVVEEAINHLVDFRKQEGSALEKKFNEKIDNIERLLKSIEPYETERVAKIRERITDALEKTISVDKEKNLVS